MTEPYKGGSYPQLTSQHFTLVCRSINWGMEQQLLLYKLCHGADMTPRAALELLVEIRRTAEATAVFLSKPLEGWPSREAFYDNQWDARQALFLKRLLIFMASSAWGASTSLEKEVSTFWLYILDETSIATIKDLRRHLDELTEFCRAIINDAAGRIIS